MRTFAAAAAALTCMSFVPRAALAQSVQPDPHTPTVSPETSSGVEPRTTREIDRGMPSDLSGSVPAERLQEKPRPKVGTTTTTGATYEAGAERVGPNRTLLVTGSALFLATYGTSVLVGSTVGTDEDRLLAVPVVGPWLTIGQRTCALQCELGDDVNFFALVGSGIAQAAGIGLALASFFVPERRASSSPHVDIVPMANGSGTAGLRAIGRF